MQFIKHNGGPTKKKPDRPYGVAQVYLVPCGKCAFCQQARRDSWAFRIYHESATQKYPGWFLTMTYDERHVPRTNAGMLTLRFYDIQLYLKRLRKQKYYAKYIAVGEYGAKTDRPHYHMLLWTDAPVEFLEANWKSSKDGSRMGSVHFGTLTAASSMYTLKYILQPKPMYRGREKPRAQFSRFIGAEYMTQQVMEWHSGRDGTQEPIMYSWLDGKKRTLPRYYRNYLFIKPQLEKFREKFVKEQRKKKEELHDRLRTQGVVDVREYERKLRGELADRLRANYKYNLTI